MEEKQRRDIEEGIDNDNKSRKSFMQKVFQSKSKKAEYLEGSKKNDLKSLKKLSSIHPPEVIEFETKRKSKRGGNKELFEDEPLASVALGNGDIETSYEGLDRSLVDPPKFPIGAGSPMKSRNLGASFVDQKKKKRKHCIRQSFYCTMLACVVTGAILVGLYFTGHVTFENVSKSNWKDGPAGQLSPSDQETDLPQYDPNSNLFEGDEIVACTNAEAMTAMNRPYFGSTWKSFWDSRINTCGDQMSTGYSIWYTYTSESSKLVEASTCENADFDTQITVLSGSCGELECVSFNDQACGDQSLITWYAEANVTYYLMVSGYREASGTFGLTMKEAYNNDDCFEPAGPLELGSVVAGTTAGAQAVEVPPKCGDVDMTTPGVWYEIANVTGFVRAEVLRGYTDFSGQVAVYRSMDDLDMGCGALLCDKGSSTGNVTWLAEAKETYYLYVNGFNGTAGDFDLFFGENVPSTCRKATQLDPNTIGYMASTINSNPQNVESCGYTGYHTAPGLWFSVEGTGEILEVSTCGSMKDLDTQISVFGNGCYSLQCIGGTGQDYPCGDNGSVKWKTEMGEIYHIFVSGRSSRVGDFVLDIKEVSRINGYSCPAALSLDMGATTFASSTLDAPSQPVELCDGSSAVRGVWHELIGTGKAMRISACNDETDFDVRLSLYTGSCDGLSCVANTRSKCGERDEILVTTHAGHKYYVFVHGPDSFSIGNYRLDVDEAVINDSCDTAADFTLSPARYFGSTLSASVSSSTECADSATNSIALWYKIVGTGETATFSTCSEMTDFSTDIAVFSGSCSMLWCVENSSKDCGNKSSVAFQTIENEVYYVRVGGNTTDDSGNFVLDVTNMSPFFGSG